MGKKNSDTVTLHIVYTSGLSGREWSGMFGMFQPQKDFAPCNGRCGQIVFVKRVVSPVLVCPVPTYGDIVQKRKGNACIRYLEGTFYFFIRRTSCESGDFYLL